VLSLRHFRAGEMVFFIPWRVVAEGSGAAHLDLLDRLEPPGRQMARSTLRNRVVRSAAARHCIA
jgi:hypothetical protein